jgi:hypothetical protein
VVKRTRKPPIKPEVRRDWLRRNEENGESPPQIAAKDGYDVRTVRKQIETAKQEREAREARSLVLRNALERHYDDLRNLAEKLNSRISGFDNVVSSPDDDLLEAALRQHLPRSPMWNYMLKRQSLQQKSDEQLKRIEDVIEQAAKEDRRLTPLVTAGLNGVINGIVTALVAQVGQWSRGSTGLNLKDNLVIEPAGEGFMSLRWGFSQMGKMDQEHAEGYVKIVLEVLGYLESNLREWEAYRDLEKTIAEIGRLGRKLREELAVIRLRRIIPGHCRYCPL